MYPLVWSNDLHSVPECLRNRDPMCHVLSLAHHLIGCAVRLRYLVKYSVSDSLT